MPSPNQASKLNCSQLPAIPNIKWLMMKAPFKRGKKQSPPVLPDNELWVDNVKVDEQQLGLFHQVVEWQGNTSIMHPCYIHTLAFPIHLKLLLEAAFPFPLLGLVHIENEIHQYRPVECSETLKLACRLGELEVHKKGWLFSVITECFIGDELVWQSTSSNLFRTKHNLAVATKVKNAPLFDKNIHSNTWPLEADLGRNYAKSSGDFNPIHLRKWSAKLFGFKQQIAHGMWTKSRCISALYALTPDSFKREFVVNVRFKQPLYLPAEVVMLTHKTSPQIVNNEYRFKVESQHAEQDNVPHLVGDISFNNF